eukprot:122367-Chlamydomonas_euryale.AAC.1
MFNAEELQLLIGGTEEGIRLDDLQAHMEYAGVDGGMGAEGVEPAGPGIDVVRKTRGAALG